MLSAPSGEPPSLMGRTATATPSHLSSSPPHTFKHHRSQPHPSLVPGAAALSRAAPPPSFCQRLNLCFSSAKPTTDESTPPPPRPIPLGLQESRL